MTYHRALRSIFAAAVATSVLFAVPGAALAEAVKVRAAVIPVLGAAPLFVAEREGWLKAAGIDLTTTTFESGPNAIQAAASGGFELYVAGITPVAVGRTKGIDFKVVAATAIDENVLVSGAKLKSFFKAGVKPAEAFKAYKAEAGRPAKIATQPPGSVPSTNLSYWLFEAQHVDPADVQIVPMGIDATQQAMLAGAVDAAIIREPTLTIVQQRNPQITLLASGEDLFPGQPGTVVAVWGPFAEQHPEIVTALVEGIARAIEKIKKDPDGSLPAIETALSKGLVDPALLRKSLSSPAVNYVSDPKAILAPTKAMLEYQVKIKTLTEAPDINKVFDLTFYEKAMSPVPHK